MIIEAIGGLFLGIIDGVLSALPTYHLTIPSFGPMVGLARALDGFLPVHEVIDFLSLTVQVTIVIFAFKLVMYVYANLPFKAT